MTDRIRIKCTVAALLAALVCLSGWTFDGGQLASAPLDKDCLPDGTYAVEVTMVKLNRRDLSMANDAVNHSVKLTVEGGAYSATVDFRGLKINNYFGYLGTLMYYGEGFVFDEFGLPQGETKEAEVLATQKDADGQEVVDAYNRDTGKPYPDILRFPLVRKAGFEDGDVPLRVFVPIMESISAGTGTQDVLMRIDWATLRTAVEGDFVPDAPPVRSPALSYTDRATGLVFAADAGVFPAGTLVGVARTKSGKRFEDARKAVGVAAGKLRLYRIAATVSGSAVEPEGNLTVSLPTDGFASAELRAYRIADDGGKTQVSGVSGDGLYSIVVNRLGYYALVDGRTGGSASGSASGSADGSGDDVQGGLSVGADGAAGAGQANGGAGTTSMPDLSAYFPAGGPVSPGLPAGSAGSAALAGAVTAGGAALAGDGSGVDGAGGLGDTAGVDGADGTGAVAGQGTLSAAVGADSRRQGDAPLPIPLLILEALAILSVCGAVFVIAKLRRALGRGGFGEARIGRGRIGDDRFGKGGVAA